MATVYLNRQVLSACEMCGRMAVKEDGKIIQSIAIQDVERVVISGHAHISTPLMERLLEQGTSVIFLRGGGKTLGIAAPVVHKVNRFIYQVRFLDDEPAVLDFAKEIIRQKIAGECCLISDYIRNSRLTELKYTLDTLKIYQNVVSTQSSINGVRGMEGIAAREYFNSFGIILANSGLQWPGRIKNHSTDPVNALLSYGYGIVAGEVAASLHLTGLNPGISYIHALDNYRDSLVYDFLEPFRAPLIDRLVLKTFNLRMIKEKDFYMEEERCLLKEEPRGRFIALYDKMMGQNDLDDKLSNRDYIRHFINEFAKKLDADYGGK